MTEMWGRWVQGLGKKQHRSEKQVGRLYSPSPQKPHPFHNPCQKPQLQIDLWDQYRNINCTTLIGLQFFTTMYTLADSGDNAKKLSSTYITIKDSPRKSKYVYNQHFE